MATKILTPRQIKHAKRMTLGNNYKCDNCGQPAMTQEGDRQRCPACWLREKGKQIKPLDHTGYYP